MRILITGARGLLGAAISHRFSGEAEVQAADHQSLDITDPSAVAAIVNRTRPDAIVNCAAYNDVDGAESNATLALRVNAFAALTLARAARDVGAAFVHYSSDFVFDGEASAPYGEDDPPNPRSAYGSSKLLGDWLAADAPRHYVLRVASLFGGPGVHTGARRGSLGTIVDRIRGNDEVPVFVDRTVSPSYTPDIASATWQLLAGHAAPGVYHCVNSGATSWAVIAKEAARLLGRTARIREMTLDSASLKAARPRYCALSNARLAAAGISMPPWQDALARYVAEL